MDFDLIELLSGPNKTFLYLNIFNQFNLFKVPTRLNNSIMLYWFFKSSESKLHNKTFKFSEKGLQRYRQVLLKTNRQNFNSDCKIERCTKRIVAFRLTELSSREQGPVWSSELDVLAKYKRMDIWWNWSLKDCWNTGRYGYFISCPNIKFYSSSFKVLLDIK